MLTWKRNQSAFTLIELLVVVIIVAVLAAVGIPLLSGNIERARATEADAGLGTVRTAMRAELAEHGAYNVTVAAPVAPVAAGIGINAGDLTGRFFEDDDYSIVTATETDFCVGTTGDTAAGVPAVQTAPRGIDVNLVERSMNAAGNIFDQNNCTGNVLN